MNNTLHNDSFSIAIDDVLLKLSKEYGIALPKDDYLLVHLFLNKEIILSALDDSLEKIKDENERNSNYYRQSLIALAKHQNEIEQQHNVKIKSLLVVSGLSLLVSMIAIIAAVLL